MFTFVVWCIGLCFIYVIGCIVIGAIVAGFQAIQGKNDYCRPRADGFQDWARPAPLQANAHHHRQPQAEPSAHAATGAVAERDPYRNCKYKISRNGLVKTVFIGK